MEASLAKVIVPLQVAAVALELIRAPEEPRPTPFNVRPSDVSSVYPFKLRLAPDETNVIPPVDPKGPVVAVPVDPNFSIPWLMEVEPE